MKKLVTLALILYALFMLVPSATLVYASGIPQANLTFSVSKSEIALGESFTVEARLENVGDETGSDFVGSLFICIPTLSQSNYIEQASVSIDGDIPVSQKIASDEITYRDGNQVKAKYFEARADKIGWVSGERHYLRIVVTPETTGEFSIYFRGGFIQISTNTFVSYDPPLGLVNDHRGWPIHVGAVNVTLISPSAESASTQDSKFARFDIDNIVAETEISGTLVAEFEETIEEKPISLAPGDTLQQSLVFSLVSPANWSLELFSEGTTILLAQGNLNVLNETASYEVTSAFVDTEVLRIDQEKETISIVIGRVSGSMEAEVHFHKEIDAMASIGLDADGDGEMTGGEVTEERTTGMVASFATPIMESIPLTTVYEVKVLMDGKLIAFNSGTYDFAKGETVKSTRYIDSKAVSQLSLTYKRVPYVAFIPLPNTMFELPQGEARAQPQSEQSTVDILKAEETAVSPVEPQPDEVPRFAGDIWGALSNFLSRYWPLLAIIGAILLGGTLVARLMFGSK